MKTDRPVTGDCISSEIFPVFFCLFVFVLFCFVLFFVRSLKKRTASNRKILHISYKDHVTNEEVRAKIQRTIGPHEDLMTTVKRRKLQWYVYVSRSSGLAKTTLQVTVKKEEDKADRGKNWEDNIRE